MNFLIGAMVIAIAIMFVIVLHLWRRLAHVELLEVRVIHLERTEEERTKITNKEN